MVFEEIKQRLHAPFILAFAFNNLRSMEKLAALVNGLVPHIMLMNYVNVSQKTS